MTHLQRQSSPFGSYDPHYSGRLQNLQKGRLSKKCGLGVRHRKLHQAQHREEHQSSTCVSKADGPTFYTRAKRRCFARGRKYQNSVLKQSTILLTCDKVTLLCGRSWRFYTELGHSTRQRCGHTGRGARGAGSGNQFLHLSRIQLSLRRGFLLPLRDFILTFNS